MNTESTEERKDTERFTSANACRPIPRFFNSPPLSATFAEPPLPIER